MLSPCLVPSEEGVLVGRPPPYMSIYTQHVCSLLSGCCALGTNETPSSCVLRGSRENHVMCFNFSFAFEFESKMSLCLSFYLSAYLLPKVLSPRAREHSCISDSVSFLLPYPDSVDF